MGIASRVSPGGGLALGMLEIRASERCQVKLYKSHKKERTGIILIILQASTLDEVRVRE